jgi:DNA polymerase-3 subunit gamma/tau
MARSKSSLTAAPTTDVPLAEPSGTADPGEAGGSAGPGAGRRGAQYVVVARRYRPQTFDELVGQEHVARALSNAISTARVGHAYLFTGARGVGKTSAARILAKALNCVTGPAPVPCNQCDVCRMISSGDDIDVLEIDGASNRGIDEIRQLRQNANVRPSRARFKIYIIDEVHMLTREAFNALLKTLEEPPEHVKFIFCTTEPSKIPVTILSRCQRFDFAGIQTASIAERLRQIVAAEGVDAAPEALGLLARRAAGSMRDSQSLLEQLLAFAPGRITVEDVNGMLGTAGEERVLALLEHVAGGDAAAALVDLDAAVGEGVDLGLLIEQLLGYLRDCMVAAAGCPSETALHVSLGSWERIARIATRLGLETVLAAMQILDQTLARLRYSTQGRVVAELAVVRLCELENLAELPTLIRELKGAAAGSPGASERPSARGPVGPGETLDRRNAPAEAAASGTALPAEEALPAQEALPKIPLTPDSAVEVWNRAAASVGGLALDHARRFARVSSPSPDRLVVSFRPAQAFSKSTCEKAEQKARFERALAEVTGQRVQAEFVVLEEETGEGHAEPSQAMPPQQRLIQVRENAMIRRATELFGAFPARVESADDR